MQLSILIITSYITALSGKLILPTPNIIRTGELLLSITTQEEQETNPIIKRYILENKDNSYSFDKAYRDKDDESYDAVMLAKNLFDLREFKKCAHLVSKYAKNPNYQSAIFLYYYSLFMSGEMRKEEEMFENGINQQRSSKKYRIEPKRKYQSRVKSH